MRMTIGIVATMLAVLLVPTHPAVCTGVATLTTMEILRRRRLRMQTRAY